MISFPEKRLIFLVSFLVLILSIGIFSTILYRGIVTDIQDHITFIILAVRGELKIPANFLYYLAVYTASFFGSNPPVLAVASAGVLSMAVTAKFALTYKIMRALVNRSPSGHEYRTVVLLLSVAVMLLFVFSLPTWHGLQADRWYIGQIPPNVWHNSTTIFVMPFVLLLFWTSYRNLQNPAPENNLLILLWSVLNIFAKPGFYFVFVMVYPLLLLWRMGFSKRFWFNLWPVVAGVMVLFGEYVLIYQLGWDAGNRSQIKITLFKVWSHYSPNIPVSFLVSVLYPLTYLLFYGKELKTRLILQYAVLLYAAALAVMSLLTETGERELHGNFFWQSYMTAYLLFMVISVLFAEKLLQPKGWLQKQNILISAVFALHLVTGVLYVARILIYGRYF